MRFCVSVVALFAHTVCYNLFMKCLSLTSNFELKVSNTTSTLHENWYRFDGDSTEPEWELEDDVDDVDD